MRGWRLWDWITYSCFFVAAVILAADTGVRVSPELGGHIPAFVGGSLWGFAPLILFLVGTVILLARKLKSRPEPPAASQEESHQTLYVADINIASGLTPQTTAPVLLIGKAARTEQRLRIVVEHSYYSQGLGWSGWVSPQQVEVGDLGDVFIGQQIKVPIVSFSAPSQGSSLMWGKIGGPPIHAIQKGKKYRAVVRFIGSDGTEQLPIRFLLRRTSIDESPYIVDVTCETEFGEWSNMMR
jgi:hypothetical protein